MCVSIVHNSNNDLELCHRTEHSLIFKAFFQHRFNVKINSIVIKVSYNSKMSVL